MSTNPDPTDLGSGDSIILRPSFNKCGRAIRAFLSRSKRAGRHSCKTFILTLSEDPADYLSGRKRQAVRTNLHKCDELKLRAERVIPSRASSAVKAALGANADIDYLPFLLAEPHASGFENWIGYDRDAEAIAFARLKIDAEVALLTFLTAIKNDDRSLVRYRLSTDIFMSLASRGVRYVLLYYEGSPDDGNVYFAERLGFVLTDVAVAQPALSALLRSFIPKIGATSDRMPAAVRRALGT